MHKREIAVLAIKLMALFLAFQSIGSAQSLFNNWHAFPSGTALSLVLPFLLSAGIALGLGLLLWMSAENIANRIFIRQDSDIAQGQFRTPGEIMEIAFSIIGVWLVVTTGPSLINWVATYIFTLRAGYESVMGGSVSSPEEVFNIQAKANIVSLLIEFAVGIAFVVNPSKIVNIIEAIRRRTSRLGESETGQSEEIRNEKQE